MKPVRIKKSDDDTLAMLWDDGHDGRSSLEFLRDHCPCAGCQGETLLLHTYVPPPHDPATPGRYEIVDLQQVGSYAIQIFWKDGHSTGIYSWEYLRALCECATCSFSRSRRPDKTVS